LTERPERLSYDLAPFNSGFHSGFNTVSGHTVKTMEKIYPNEEDELSCEDDNVHNKLSQHRMSTEITAKLVRSHAKKPHHERQLSSVPSIAMTKEENSSHLQSNEKLTEAKIQLRDAQSELSPQPVSSTTQFCYSSTANQNGQRFSTVKEDANETTTQLDAGVAYDIARTVK